MLELYSGARCAFRTNAKVGARGKYSYDVNFSYSYCTCLLLHENLHSALYQYQYFWYDDRYKFPKNLPVWELMSDVRTSYYNP